MESNPDFKSHVEKGLEKFEESFKNPTPNVPKRSSGDVKVELVAPTEEEVAEQARAYVNKPKVVLSLGPVSEQKDIMATAACLGKNFQLQKSRKDPDQLSLTLMPQDYESLQQRVADLRDHFDSLGAELGSGKSR